MIHPLHLPNTFSLIDKKLSRIEDPDYSAIKEVIVFAQQLNISLVSIYLNQNFISLVEVKCLIFSASKLFTHL